MAGGRGVDGFGPARLARPEMAGLRERRLAAVGPPRRGPRRRRAHAGARSRPGRRPRPGGTGGVGGGGGAHAPRRAPVDRGLDRRRDARPCPSRPRVGRGPRPRGGPDRGSVAPRARSPPSFREERDLSGPGSVVGSPRAVARAPRAPALPAGGRGAVPLPRRDPRWPRRLGARRLAPPAGGRPLPARRRRRRPRHGAGRERGALARRPARRAVPRPLRGPAHPRRLLRVGAAGGPGLRGGERAVPAPPLRRRRARRLLRRLHPSRPRSWRSRHGLPAGAPSLDPPPPAPRGPRRGGGRARHDGVRRGDRDVAGGGRARVRGRAAAVAPILRDGRSRPPRGRGRRVAGSGGEPDGPRRPRGAAPQDGGRLHEAGAERIHVVENAAAPDARLALGGRSASRGDWPAATRSSP